MAAKEIKVKLRNLHIAPRKVRLIASLVKRMPVEEALAQLTLNPTRPTEPLIKLIRSAVANAKSQGMDVDKLEIKSISVDGGPMFKRMLPRAMGRGTPIQKKTSHVNLILAESAVSKPVRFDLTKAEKKPKKEKKQAKPGKEKEKAVPESKPEAKKASEKPSFFKRVFRRKSI